ncbi:MAG: 5-oxoprolinase subunit PxpB [Pyrinomonadaceae bacterium]
MLISPKRMFPLGERALTVEFGSELSDELNLAAIALASRINNSPFPGLIEAVPAIASTTVFYDPIAVSGGRGSAFDRVREFVTEALGSATGTPAKASRTLNVPVSFAESDALDLDNLAGSAGMTSQQVIEAFLGREYRVFMLGFLPGFAYMGTVDPRIALPRRPTPRLAVPAGSVAIAGNQTGVYPSVSPGGWNIIGRTDIPLLTEDERSPCFFRPGDRVRFIHAAV